MAREKNHSELLGRLAGEGGDFYIGVETIDDQKFSHIIIGPDGASLTDIKIGGASVKTARNYPATLPAGYICCAGGDDYFDYIELSAGNAEGLLYQEHQK